MRPPRIAATIQPSNKDVVRSGLLSHLQRTRMWESKVWLAFRLRGSQARTKGESKDTKYAAVVTKAEAEAERDAGDVQ